MMGIPKGEETQHHPISLDIIWANAQLRCGYIRSGQAHVCCCRTRASSATSPRPIALTETPKASQA